MDAFERRTPQYLRIYGDLKAKIERGSLAPGEQLPAQRELAERYGVTVMTVRQALQLLDQEELVVVRHGLGTYVAPTRVRFGLGRLLSVAQEVATQGLEVETRSCGASSVRHIRATPTCCCSSPATPST